MDHEEARRKHVAGKILGAFLILVADGSVGLTWPSIQASSTDRLSAARTDGTGLVRWGSPSRGCESEDEKKPPTFGQTCCALSDPGPHVRDWGGT